MNTKPRRRQRMLFTFAMLLAASAISLGVFSKVRQEPKSERRGIPLKAEHVATLPPVSSKVKDLQVTGATLLDQGTPQAAIALDIINNSDHAVTSLELVSGDADDWSGLGIDGFEDPDKPQVAIPPHSLKTFKWFLGEVLEGYPIVISAAIFADGSEDGDRRSLDIMHRDRENNRTKKARGGRQ